jgi:hypothetical protein
MGHELSTHLDIHNIAHGILFLLTSLYLDDASAGIGFGRKEFFS